MACREATSRTKCNGQRIERRPRRSSWSFVSASVLWHGCSDATSRAWSLSPSMPNWPHGPGSRNGMHERARNTSAYISRQRARIRRDLRLRVERLSCEGLISADTRQLARQIAALHLGVFLCFACASGRPSHNGRSLRYLLGATRGGDTRFVVCDRARHDLASRTDWTRTEHTSEAPWQLVAEGGAVWRDLETQLIARATRTAPQVVKRIPPGWHMLVHDEKWM